MVLLPNTFVTPRSLPSCGDAADDHELDKLSGELVNVRPLYQSASCAACRRYHMSQLLQHGAIIAPGKCFPEPHTVVSAEIRRCTLCRPV